MGAGDRNLWPEPHNNFSFSCWSISDILLVAEVMKLQGKYDEKRSWPVLIFVNTIAWIDFYIIKVLYCSCRS